jgi:hypothetical protein
MLSSIAPKDNNRSTNRKADGSSFRQGFRFSFNAPMVLNTCTNSLISNSFWYPILLLFDVGPIGFKESLMLVAILLHVVNATCTYLHVDGQLICQHLKL